MAFKKKTFNDRKKEIDDLTDALNERVDSYFQTPEQLKDYLRFKAKFYQYSNRNVALIDKQFMGAQAVAGFSFWKKNDFSVNKGEKGIKIFKPSEFKYFYRDDNKVPVSKATEKEKQDIRNEKIKTYVDRYFTVAHVFDISQTNATAKDLPKLFPNRWLDGKVENYDLVYKSLEKFAQKNGVKIVSPRSELGVAKGVYYVDRNEVALNPRNSELQNIKTLIHELAHAKMHSKEKFHNYTRDEREFQAEMTAFTVSSYLGLDTSDQSLKYIHEYSKGDVSSFGKMKFLDEVKETSQSLIEVIEENLVNEKELNKNTTREPTVVIGYSDVDGIEKNSVMTFKEANNLLLDVNEKMQSSFDQDGSPLLNNDNHFFEPSTKVHVIDAQGNVYDLLRPFTMYKIEENQLHRSLAEQIRLEEPALHSKICESYDIDKSGRVVDKEVNNLTLEGIKEKYGHLYLINNNDSLSGKPIVEIKAVRDMTEDELKNRSLIDKNNTNIFNRLNDSMTDDKSIMSTFNDLSSEEDKRVLLTDQKINQPMGYVVEGYDLDKRLMPLRELDEMLIKKEYEAQHRVGDEKVNVNYMYPDQDGKMRINTTSEFSLGDGSFSSLRDQIEKIHGHEEVQNMALRWSVDSDLPKMDRSYLVEQIESYTYKNLKELDEKKLNGEPTTGFRESECLAEKFSSIAVGDGYLTKKEVNEAKEKALERFAEEKYSEKQAGMETLKDQFTAYQHAIKNEKNGDVNVEKIVERLKHENTYEDTKAEMIKAGTFSKSDVSALEKSVLKEINPEKPKVAHSQWDEMER